MPEVRQAIGGSVLGSGITSTTAPAAQDGSNTFGSGDLRKDSVVGRIAEEEADRYMEEQIQLLQAQLEAKHAEMTATLVVAAKLEENPVEMRVRSPLYSICRFFC
jgi:hypothetical protein